MTMRDEFDDWFVQQMADREFHQRDRDAASHVWQAAYAAGQRAEREACAQAVEAEAVDAQETGAEGDHAYNRALEHAAAAIRNRKDQA